MEKLSLEERVARIERLLAIVPKEACGYVSLHDRLDRWLPDADMDELLVAREMLEAACLREGIPYFKESNAPTAKFILSREHLASIDQAVDIVRRRRRQNRRK